MDYANVKKIVFLKVHDVEFAPSIEVILNETLPALEKLVKTGQAKYIGISGYPLSTLLEVVEKSSINISCILSYCRNTLVDNSLLDFLPLFEASIYY